MTRSRDVTPGPCPRRRREPRGGHKMAEPRSPGPAAAPRGAEAEEPKQVTNGAGQRQDRLLMTGAGVNCR